MNMNLLQKAVGFIRVEVFFPLGKFLQHLSLMKWEEVVAAFKNVQNSSSACSVSSTILDHLVSLHLGKKNL